jgi:hypothetical protein
MDKLPTTAQQRGSDTDGITAKDIVEAGAKRSKH